ncbi:MAG: chemoreceptor glutamine deamidase CheD [Burkholderiaceae bacterium]
MAAETTLEMLRRRPRQAHRAAFFYQDAVFGRCAVKIAPGEYYVDTEGLVLTTVLGSCISVCLVERQGAICGLNHFMLPEARGKADSARYGLFAMELLINEMLKAGASRRGLQAKVYGGGAVISGMSSMQIGQQNVTFVDEFLKREGIGAGAMSSMSPAPDHTMTGGNGRCWCKSWPKTTNSASEEKRYARTTARQWPGQRDHPVLRRQWS